jgi:hypothetical protein
MPACVSVHENAFRRQRRTSVRLGSPHKRRAAFSASGGVPPAAIGSPYTHP